MKSTYALALAMLSLPAVSETQHSPVDAFYIPAKGTIEIGTTIGYSEFELTDAKTEGDSQFIDFRANYAICDALSLSINQSYKERNQDGIDKISGLENTGLGLSYSKTKNNLLWSVGLESQINTGSESIKNKFNAYSLSGQLAHKAKGFRYGVSLSINETTEDTFESGYNGNLFLQYLISEKNSVTAFVGGGVEEKENEESERTVFGAAYSYTSDSKNVFDVGIDFDNADIADEVTGKSDELKVKGVNLGYRLILK